MIRHTVSLPLTQAKLARTQLLYQEANNGVPTRIQWQACRTLVMSQQQLGCQGCDRTRLEHRMRCASSTDGVNLTGSAVSAQINKNVLPPKLLPGRLSGRRTSLAPACAHHNQSTFPPALVADTKPRDLHFQLCWMYATCKCCRAKLSWMQNFVLQAPRLPDWQLAAPLCQVRNPAWFGSQCWMQKVRTTDVCQHGLRCRP